LGSKLFFVHSVCAQGETAAVPNKGGMHRRYLCELFINVMLLALFYIGTK